MSKPVEVGTRVKLVKTGDCQRADLEIGQEGTVVKLHPHSVWPYEVLFDGPNKQTEPCEADEVETL